MGSSYFCHLGYNCHRHLILIERARLSQIALMNVVENELLKPNLRGFVQHMSLKQRLSQYFIKGVPDPWSKQQQNISHHDN